MKVVIRKLVLSIPFLRELFFFVTRHKTNLKKIQKMINKMDTKCFFYEQIIQDCIIALTSYGNRIKELQYTLYSLVAQSYKPFKIIVYIADVDFNNIPSYILNFEKYGVEFHKVPDYKSYKKLIPGLKEYSDFNLVTADDDLYYPKKWFENLYLEHLNYPKDIVCQQYIEVTYDKEIKPFKYWIVNPYTNTSLRTMCVLGGSGTLYPPHSLYKDAVNYDLVLNIAPFADDLWFYFMAILNNTKIRQIKKSWRSLRYVNVYREYGIVNGNTLTQINVAEGKNDIQFRKILKHYNLSDKMLIGYYNKVIDKLI